MKTSFATSLVAIAAALAPAATGTVVTAQQKISSFNPEDFAFSLGGPEPADPADTGDDGFLLRAVNVNQLPALEGQGISMALVNLDPCSINLPHVHPRATEMLYTIKGDIRVAFVEENDSMNDGDAVVNDLMQGDVAFFSQGLIHYQQNLGCEPATFLAALNSEDPGAVTITTRFFELPSEAIQASLNIQDPALKALIGGLPEAPAAARQQCLKMCGLPYTEEEMYSYDYGHDSYDYSYESSKTGGKRNLRSYDYGHDSYDYGYESYVHGYESYDYGYESNDYGYDSYDYDYEPFDYGYESSRAGGKRNLRSS